ncbi:synaptic vesicle glycoprotein 2C-like isoform X2 [Mytilus galloprovincialis]
MEGNFKMSRSDEYDPLIANQEESSDVNPDAVPYEEALKETGYGRFHFKVLALCGWAVSSDAIEVLSVSFLLPAASCDLDIGSSDKGWLNAIVFIGMLLGGYFWGSLADHQGRRSILMWSLTVNGIGVLASSVVQTFWAFLLCRFISGIGVGGSIPVIFSYFTEFQPKEKRGMMISALATFWMCGNIIAAGLAWAIIPRDIGYISSSFKFSSWRIFVATCAVPSLSSAFLFTLMPESPKFLLIAGKASQAIKVLTKVHDSNFSHRKSKEYKIKSLILATDTSKAEYLEQHNGNDVGCIAKLGTGCTVLKESTKQLFRPPLLKSTVLMLIVNFVLAFGYYGLWMWFPELFSRMKDGGSPCDQSNSNFINQTSKNETTCNYKDNWVYFSGFMTALSNLPGNILTIFLMDRIGRKQLLAMSMVLSGVSVFFIPLIHNKYENLGISCVFGAVSTVGWNALDVLSAELFPTSLRSTAFGIMSGIGRIAAILGNLTFGELIDVHCAIPMIIVAALLVFGGLSSIKLPNTTKTDIH